MAADYARRAFPVSPRFPLRKMLNRGTSKSADSFGEGGNRDTNENDIRQRHFSLLMPTLPVYASSVAPSAGPFCSP